MELWTAWNACVLALRPACSRQVTFEWMRIVLMWLCVRIDRAGVTSLVRALAHDLSIWNFLRSRVLGSPEAAEPGGARREIKRRPPSIPAGDHPT